MFLISGRVGGGRFLGVIFVCTTWLFHIFFLFNDNEVPFTHLCGVFYLSGPTFHDAVVSAPGKILSTLHWHTERECVTA